MKEQEIFIEALQRDDALTRENYLQAACGDDFQLRRSVEELLADQARDDSFFLDNPVAGGASVDFPTLSVPLGTLVGPYKLLEQIGEGGFGIVYSAEQTEPVRRRVALKIIKPGMDTRDVITRFEAERQALAMMDHPHIAKVFDAGTTDTGRPYFAMELVKGIAISEYCDQCNLPTRERLKLFISVCQAVQHAHQKGIIHRDLKPTNVLVAMQDGELAPKIIDFGVAKAMGPRLTEHTFVTTFAQMVGTPMYMSPEQAQMSPLEVDTRTDIYSLGVLLYELLTGTTPFEKERLKEASFDELRRIIREEEPPTPSSRLSTLGAAARTTAAEQRRTEPRRLGQLVRGELDWIVMKCLEKDRHRRYASAKELEDDVERYLGDEPVQARPTSTIYRIAKFTRRNRVLVASVAAVLVALSTGLVLATAGFVTAQRRLVQVEQERANYETVIQLIQEMYDVPWGGAIEGKELKVGDVINELSDRLNERALEQPQVEIELRRIVALMYARIGEHEKTRDHLLRALELGEGPGGYDPHDEKYADLLVDVARLFERRKYFPLIRRSESQKYARKALEIYDELDITNGHVATCCYVLAYSLGSHSGAGTPECVRLLQRELDIATHLAETGEVPRENWASQKTWALMDLAGFWNSASRHGSEKAIEYAQQAVDVSVQVFGIEESLTGNAQRHLGICYRHQGNVDEAIKHLDNAWGVAKEHYQREPAAHRIAYELAETYLLAGRHNEANGVLDDLERICREHGAWESLVDCLYLRGWGEYLRANYRAAKVSLSEASSLADAHLGEFHSLQGFVRFYLALTFSELEETSKAQQEYQRLRPFLDEWYKMSEGELSPLLYSYALALVRTSTGDEASLERPEEIADIALKTPKTPQQHGWEAPFLFVQAMALRQQGLDHAAIDTLQKAIDHITRPYPSMQSHSKDILRPRWKLEATLAAYYVELERFDDAVGVFEAGIRFRKEHFPENHLQVALAELRYGEFLVEQGEFERAEEQLLSAYEKLSANPEAAPATAQRAADQLTRVYEATDRPDEAARRKGIVEELRRSSDQRDDKPRL